MNDTAHYRSLNSWLWEQFGEKVYKLALDGGFTCPSSIQTGFTAFSSFSSPMISPSRQSDLVAMETAATSGCRTVRE